MEETKTAGEDGPVTFSSDKAILAPHDPVSVPADWQILQRAHVGLSSIVSVPKMCTVNRL